MRALLLFALLALATVCLGHGSTHPMPPPGGGGGGIQPTGGGGGGAPPSGGGGGPPAGGGGLGGLTPGRKKGAGPAEWQMWWERNREHLVKMRTLMRRSTAVTGKKEIGRADPMGNWREGILATLRHLARRAGDSSLRAAAVMALGRMGGDEDAKLFLSILRGQEATVVTEAAIVALAILPRLDGPTRSEVRSLYRALILRPRRLPTRARGLLLLSAGLRARQDPALVQPLLERAGRSLKTDDTANLLYAFGLTGSPLVAPELLRAVRRGRFARDDLDDVARAHAVQALALVEAPGRTKLLCVVLASRRARIQTKRSAAMALARMLREKQVPLYEYDRVRITLVATLEDAHDPTLRGYAAIALGSGESPLGVKELMKEMDSGASHNIRPYLAIALGLAARDLGDAKGQKIREYLHGKLKETREPERASSLSIALGLARGLESEDLLLKRLKRKSSPAGMRGAAAQGLGLMESRSAIVMKTLKEIALEGRKPRLLEDVALALGLVGRRDVAPQLIELMRNTKSSIVQGRIIVALGHLDHSRTVPPLHDILRDRRERTSVREFASVALAFIGDRREEDILFNLDGFFNLYATTTASHELMRLY